MIRNLRTTKTLAALARKRVSEVASFEFRSLQEIKDYIKNVEKESDQLIKKWDRTKKVLAFTVDMVSAALNITELTGPGRRASGNSGKVAKGEPIKFIKPNMKKLRDAFDIIDELHDKIESMDNIIARLQLDFKGERGIAAVINESKAIRTRLQKKSASAYSFLTSLANKHEPAFFADAIKYSVDGVVGLFGKYFEKYAQTVYMTPQEHNGKSFVVISHYVELKDFVADDNFVHPNFYIVYSCVVDLDNQKVTYFVTTLKNFVPPGRYNYGMTFKNKTEAKNNTLILLESENFSSLINRQHLPTPVVEKIKWTIPDTWIKKVRIDDDTVTFDFTKTVTDKNLQQALNKILVDLKTAVAPVSKKIIVKYRKYRYRGAWTADFYLTAPDIHERKEIQIDARRARILKNQLGLTDKQITQLIKSINTMED